MAMRPIFLPNSGVRVSAPTWRDINSSFEQAAKGGTLFQENIVNRKSQDFLQAALADGQITPQEIAGGGSGLDVSGLLKTASDYSAAQDLSVNRDIENRLNTARALELEYRNQ